METSIIAVTQPAVDRAERTAFWRARVAEQAASGLTLRQFSQAHQLSYDQLRRWRRRLRLSEGTGEQKPAKTNRGAGDVPLLPVQLVKSAPASTSGMSLELHYRQCYRLVIPAEVDTRLLQQVLTILEQCHADAAGRA